MASLSIGKIWLPASTTAVLGASHRSSHPCWSREVTKEHFRPGPAPNRGTFPHVSCVREVFSAPCAEMIDVIRKSYTLWWCQNSYWTWPEWKSGFKWFTHEKNMCISIVILIYQRVKQLCQPSGTTGTVPLSLGVPRVPRICRICCFVWKIDFLSALQVSQETLNNPEVTL